MNQNQPKSAQTNQPKITFFQKCQNLIDDFNSTNIEEEHHQFEEAILYLDKEISETENLFKAHKNQLSGRFSYQHNREQNGGQGGPERGKFVKANNGKVMRLGKSQKPRTPASLLR